MSKHQLHLGLLQGPQPCLVYALSLADLLLSLELTRMSPRLFGPTKKPQRQAMRKAKCQFRSAIPEIMSKVCGSYAVTRQGDPAVCSLLVCACGIYIQQLLARGNGGRKVLLGESFQRGYRKFPVHYACSRSLVQVYKYFSRRHKLHRPETEL